MSEMMKQGPILGSVLILSEDNARKAQLREKLLEYKGRLDPYRAPELQMGTICKIAVLGQLLEYGFVNTDDLYAEMREIYGDGFNPHKFNTACGVIDNYCKTGGDGNVGGTGLPNLNV